jgi:hypothetical protein
MSRNFKEVGQMNKMELLLQRWEYCYDKEDWYPPLLDALQGVTAENADWWPEGAAVNTIWENVHHLIFYKERLLGRLKGTESEYPSGITNDDTFAVPSKEESDWQDTLVRLDKVHKGIREFLASLNEEEFEKPVGTTTIGRWVTSLISHDAYHTGKIIQLRKLQGSWPATTSYS